MRFMLLGLFELPWYAVRRQRYSDAGCALASLAVFLTVFGALWVRCWVAAFYTLLLPFMLSSLALMFGNWSQHIFVNPASPEDDFSLTYNCLQVRVRCRPVLSIWETL